MESDGNGNLIHKSEPEKSVASSASPSSRMSEAISVASTRWFD